MAGKRGSGGQGRSRGSASGVLRKWLKSYLSDTRRLDVAVLLTAPLFVAYEAGLLFLTRGDVRNAADVRLKEWAMAVHPQVPLVLNTLLLLGFVAAAIRREKVPVAAWLTPALLMEACVYALLLGPLCLLMTRGIPLMAGGLSGRPVNEAIFAMGAGLYEEILFRLIIVGGLVWLLEKRGGFPRWIARGGPVVFSAALFSLFHHVGPLGDPFAWKIATYRFVAGLALGGLFLARGFTVSVWTHALYDIGLAI